MPPFKDFIKREKDAVTGISDLEPLVEFPAMSIHMGVTECSPGEDKMANMRWLQSQNSGCIQLENLIPLPVLYGESHGSGQIGGLWQTHHKAFAQFIAQYTPRQVLELGGGHGILSREYKNLADADWTIIEPNPTPAPGVTANYIDEIIDEKFTPTRVYDAFIHSHVMEHMYNPSEFIANVARLMPEASWHFCSFPNMAAQLQRNYTNVLNFEHTYYLIPEYAEFIFSNAGYELIEKTSFKEDHSLFYAFRKSTPPPLQ